ncbi:F-box/LRR-repeat protein [Trifolium pratense]|uniref:F-box/LRR-repeat protein n=1 Tax=Trifolium pratense TaxID=57577 RepID=A0A2K3LVE3_TRIPR|nr:F-box/LRR-repeat protein [Trifolium pratense]
MEKFCGRGSKSCMLIGKSVKVDRISELPEELLIHILSFLPPKFACTTSILSKRWKPLCQFLTVFRFDDKSVKNEEEFILFNMFINKVMLSKDRQQSIKVFHLRCHSALSLINHDEWVEAAKRRGIEDLQLSMFQFVMVRKMYLSCYNSMMDKFITISPNGVFSCRTLVILKLKRLCVSGNILSIDLLIED